MIGEIIKSIFGAGKDAGSGAPAGLIVSILILSILSAIVKHKSDELKGNQPFRAIILFVYVVALIIFILSLISIFN